jgi:small basic protein (TIGR04137 family)
MSIHKSLVSGARLRRQRNVLTRWERILQLKQEERWADGRSVFSLPKVRVVHAKKHKKPKKEVVEGEGVAVEGAAVAAPAAEAGKGAKGAPAAKGAAGAKAAAPAAKGAAPKAAAPAAKKPAK